MRHKHNILCKGLVINYRGGGLQNGRGSFTPTKKGGGGGICSRHTEEGGGVTHIFKVVWTRVLKF